MKLGFIGTGEITKAVVIGILGSKLRVKKIYLSERNKKVSSFLRKKNKKIQIEKNNQVLIDKSDWVFLAVTPKVGNQIIGKLNFKKKQVIVSFISTIQLPRLKKLTKINKDIVRAIPLPPISLRKGPIPIFPPNKKVKKFFSNLGTVIQINNEKKSLNFWSTSGMMAPFYEFINTLSRWLILKGIKRENAQNYITSLFVALSENAQKNSGKDLSILVKNSQTSGGLNEQGVKLFKKFKFYKSTDKTLNDILKRLKKN
jgi:pyrroline-5-carboxylate reductase